MDLKVSVEFDLSDYIERWGDDSLEECIKDEIKNEVLRAVRSSQQYRDMIARNTELMLNSLDLDS